MITNIKSTINGFYFVKDCKNSQKNMFSFVRVQVRESDKLFYIFTYRLERFLNSLKSFFKI